MSAVAKNEITPLRWDASPQESGLGPGTKLISPLNTKVRLFLGDKLEKLSVPRWLPSPAAGTLVLAAKHWPVMGLSKSEF